MKYYFQVWKKYASTKGRATRSEYWYFFLFNFVFSFAVGFVGGLTHKPILSTLYTLAVFLPSIAVAVRRIQDTGRSGWFLLVPVYNFVLLVTDGVQGENHYGPDPKGPTPPDFKNVHPGEFQKEKQKLVA